MKINKLLKKQFLFILTILLLTNCSVNLDEEEILPQEEITKLSLKLTDLSSNIEKNYIYNVGNPSPEVDLLDGHTYKAELDFFNGNTSISNEILEEKDDHFIEFRIVNLNLNLTRTDNANATQSGGQKLGLSSEWKINQKIINPNNPSYIQVKLIHDATSVNDFPNNLGSHTGGETDVEVFFKVKS